MKAFDQLERLKQMNRLINEERTGTSDEFARHLNVSRRQLFYLLEEIKGFGVEIDYSKSRRTYFFSSEHVLELDYTLKVLPKNEIVKINGGFVREKLQSAFFMHSVTLI